MSEFLIKIDIELFVFINQSIANPILDMIMPFITNFRHWIPVYIIFIVLGLWKGGSKGRIAVIALIITVGLTDFVNGSILKEIFERVRPCRELVDIRLLISCGPGFSFPSNHAANSFAMAGILSFFYARLWYLFFSFAALIALSRVYCGVHYPADIIGGAITGLTISFIIIIILKLSVPDRFLGK